MYRYIEALPATVSGSELDSDSLFLARFLVFLLLPHFAAKFSFREFRARFALCMINCLCKLMFAYMAHKVR